MSERVSFSPTPTHPCAALGCRKNVSDRFLMCMAHWWKVPQDVRDAVYHEYFRGIRKHQHPTPEYTAVVKRAVDHVARVERRIAA